MKTKIAKFLFAIIGTAVVFFAGATVSERLIASVNNWHIYLIVATAVLVITAIFFALGRGSKLEELCYNEDEEEEQK